MPFVSRPYYYLDQRDPEFGSDVYQYLRYLHRSSAYVDLSFRQSPGKFTLTKGLSLHGRDSRNWNVEFLDLDSDRRVIGLHEKWRRRRFLSFYVNYVVEFWNLLADKVLDKVQSSRDLDGAMRNHLSILRTIINSAEHSEYKSNLTRHVVNRAMKLLFEHSQDSHLIVAVVTSLTSTHEFLVHMGGSTIRRPQLLEYVTHHSQRARFDFWGVLWDRPVQRKKRLQCMVGYPCMYRGHNFEMQEVLRILLKYGVSIGKVACEVFNKFNFEWYHERFRRMDIETDEGSDRRQTLLHILLCFCLVKCAGELCIEQAEECIRMIWDYLPDAYHSVTELEEYVKPQVKLLGYSSAFSQDKWIALCNWYLNNVAVEAMGKLEPRSLKQLCRVSIRKTLARNFQLPEGIDDLGLPPPIQKYLRLDGDFFYLTYFNSSYFNELLRKRK